MYYPLEYFQEVIGKFVDVFVTPDPDNENVFAHIQTDMQRIDLVQTINADHEYIMQNNDQECRRPN